MARKRQETLVLFPDILTGTRKMSDEQFGALMRAVFAYRFEGTEQEFDDPMVDIAFGFVKTQLDRHREVCEINRKNRTSRESEEIEREEISTDSHEMQRNATEFHEIQRNPTHNHNHNHNRTHNRTHNHTHNHDRNHSCLGLKADKPPTTMISPPVDKVKQYCTSTGIPQQFVNNTS